MARPVLWLLLAATLVPACTSRQLYEAGQQHQREQCQLGPISEFDECMRRANISYETYEQGRQEVKKDQSP